MSDNSIDNSNGATPASAPGEGIRIIREEKPDNSLRGRLRRV